MMANQKRYTLMLLVAGAFLAGCEAQNSINQPRDNIKKSDDDNPIRSIDLSNAIGKKAPEIKLEAAFYGLPAADLTLANLRGKVVVLDYWATW